MSQSILDSFTPHARIDGLITTEIDSELLVFDTEANQVHNLNPTAAAIWRASDGLRSVADIAALVPGTPSCDVVRAGLAQLAEAGLLTNYAAPPQTASSRRTLLRRAAVAGTLAIPAVVSISAPASVAATSHLPASVVITQGAISGGRCSITVTLLNGVQGTSVLVNASISPGGLLAPLLTAGEPTKVETIFSGDSIVSATAQLVPSGNPVPVSFPTRVCG